MARRLRPLVEREAIWAFVLALLGSISMYLTLPAAIVLSDPVHRGQAPGRRRIGAGDRSVRARHRLAQLPPGLPHDAHDRRARWSRVPDRYRAVGFAIGWAILAGVIGLLVWFMIRSHPERWLARRLAVAGVVTIVAAGGFQLAAAGLTGRCDVRGGTLIDCVGVTPWIAIAPALAIGGMWLAIALSATALRRAIHAVTA